MAISHNPPTKAWEYIIGVDDDKLTHGITRGHMPTSVADSAATSSVGTIKNPCPRTGQSSWKSYHSSWWQNCPGNWTCNMPIQLKTTRQCTSPMASARTLFSAQWRCRCQLHHSFWQRWSQYLWCKWHHRHCLQGSNLAGMERHGLQSMVHTPCQYGQKSHHGDSSH